MALQKELTNLSFFRHIVPNIIPQVLTLVILNVSKKSLWSK
ncbi:MAG TPA: hypothetical protein VGI33_07845 [Paenibacillus sp.]